MATTSFLPYSTDGTTSVERKNGSAHQPNYLIHNKNNKAIMSTMRGNSCSTEVVLSEKLGGNEVSSFRPLRRQRMKALYINSAGQRPADMIAPENTSPERALSLIAPLQGFSGFTLRSIGRCPILLIAPFQGFAGSQNPVSPLFVSKQILNHY